MMKRPLILCVDNEENGLEGRKMLLEQSGYGVLVAAGGVEAMQLFASHPIDLVLLDYHMPHMNGDVIARQMKAIQSDVPIALLSGDDYLSGDVLRSADGFISKSEPPVVFLEIVDHLVDLRFLFAPINGLDGHRQDQSHGSG